MSQLGCNSTGSSRSSDSGTQRPHRTCRISARPSAPRGSFSCSSGVHQQERLRGGALYRRRHPSLPHGRAQHNSPAGAITNLRVPCSLPLLKAVPGAALSPVPWPHPLDEVQVGAPEVDTEAGEQAAREDALYHRLSRTAHLLVSILSPVTRLQNVSAGAPGGSIGTAAWEPGSQHHEQRRGNSGAALDEAWHCGSILRWKPEEATYT